MEIVEVIFICQKKISKKKFQPPPLMINSLKVRKFWLFSLLTIISEIVTIFSFIGIPKLELGKFSIVVPAIILQINGTDSSNNAIHFTFMGIIYGFIFSIWVATRDYFSKWLALMLFFIFSLALTLWAITFYKEIWWLIAFFFVFCNAEFLTLIGFIITKFSDDTKTACESVMFISLIFVPLNATLLEGFQILDLWWSWIIAAICMLVAFYFGYMSTEYRALE